MRRLRSFRRFWALGPLGRFRSLPPADRRLFLRALAALASVRAGLWLLPFGRLRARVARAARPRPGSRVDSARVAWAIPSAARFVPAATCLTQALAAKVLLGRAGAESALQIGVALDGGRMRAHAWVESGGAVLVGGDHDLTNFSVLPSIEGETT